jgi:hypothetical protein
MHRRPHPIAFAVLAFGAVALAAPAARADTHLVVEAATDFPLDVAARVLVEAPGRIRITGSVGVMPSLYANGYTGTEVLFTKYNQDTAEVVRSALNSSLIGRLHLGWRPWEAHGFYFDLGYSFAAFGGGTSAAAMFYRATGRTPPDEGDMSMVKPENNMNPYSVNQVLHMADLEIGWTWKLFWQLEARVAGGVAFTFASTSSINPAFPSKAPTVEQTKYTSAIGGYLDQNSRYTVTPMISAALGWRIF